MKYFCYYNLHKHLFSLKSKKTNLVEHRSNQVLLTDCDFKVSQAGRARVLKEQRKNVHAGVVGTLLKLDENVNTDDMVELTYNPYKYDSFVVKPLTDDSGEPQRVASADVVFLSNRRIFAKGVVLK